MSAVAQAPAKKPAGAGWCFPAIVHDREDRKADNPDKSDKADHRVMASVGTSINNANVSDYNEPGWLSALKRSAGLWWRHHPAHLAIELATPAISSYAARNPVKFLGAAVGVGALFVVVRPWKLMSVTGLAMTLLKSSQLSGLVMSAMSAADFSKDEQRPYK